MTNDEMLNELLSTSERNELLREHFKPEDVAQARAALDRSPQRSLSQWNDSQTGTSFMPGRFASMPESRLPLNGAADSTFEHEREHIEMIRDWIARRATAV
jgi:hypothetical protein